MSRSLQEQAALVCPACSAEFNAPLWLVVDAEERPELRQAILDGTLHQSSCPRCGAGGSIKAPLLYHDPAAERVVAALPLSVASEQEARALVADLLARLIEQLPPPQRGSYLGSVELVVELDGLRELLQPPSQDPLGEQLAMALQELLDTNSSEAFREVLVRHRQLLMRREADEVLEGLIGELRAGGEHERARLAGEQRAMLSRFRTTLAQRRQRMAELLDRLVPLQDHELALLEPLRAVLDAVDEQEVYAALLQLEPAQQAALDGLLGRLVELAQAEDDEPSRDYLLALRRLRER